MRRNPLAGVTDALLGSSSLNNHVRLVPVAEKSQTVYELSVADLYECDANWDKIREKLIEKGANAAELDAGEYDATQGSSGLKVTMRND
jgi:hypothetical protein|tara:strand:- start:350 stop:616 length:267 start_codon:yes stop_codon:yes gene_type:complete